MSNLKENKKFESQEYWDDRFREEEEYDWLGHLEDFEHLLNLEKNSVILILGCGNSRLTQELEAKGKSLIFFRKNCSYTTFSNVLTPMI
jgi:hypothetical protein